MALVSIITPSHNTEKYIAQAIDSVRAQSYVDWEMLIVDDLSSDNSVKIVESYAAKDPRIQLLRSTERKGAAGSRNLAIEHAAGRYIAFLDADDLWAPEKLEKQIAFMQEENLPFTYSSYEVIDEEGERQSTFHTIPEISYESMLKTCSVGCLTAIYDSEKLGKMYLPILPTKEEYVLWLEIMKKIGHTKGLTDSLAFYRVGQISVSSDKVNAALWQWKVYREIEKLGLLKSAGYFAHYVYHGLKKYR
jgi:glycosyltransferase involved in cell wall biosynthesis